MPRQPRLDIPGGFYHIINRGIERRRIFKNKADYQLFTNQLGALMPKEGHQCYGWVLMPNHYHVLIERGNQPLSRLMNRLQTFYAGYFNRRYRRNGHLFQNRYKAILCDKESYFLELIAYLHLNPLRAGLVKTIQELSNYSWSGHRAIMGLEKSNWFAANDILGRFGKRAGEARKEYLAYLEDRSKNHQNLSGGGLIRSAGGLKVVLAGKKEERELSDTRILGDGEFVEQAVKDMDEKIKVEKELKLIDKKELMTKASELLGVSPDKLVKRGRSSQSVAQARALITYVSIEYQQAKRIEWSKQFRISQAAVSQLYNKGEVFAKGNEDVIKKIIKLYN